MRRCSAVNAHFGESVSNKFEMHRGKQFYRMKKPGTMTVMNVPERELKKYQKMGYEIIE